MFIFFYFLIQIKFLIAETALETQNHEQVQPLEAINSMVSNKALIEDLDSQSQQDKELKSLETSISPLDESENSQLQQDEDLSSKFQSIYPDLTLLKHNENVNIAATNKVDVLNKLVEELENENLQTQTKSEVFGENQNEIKTTIQNPQSNDIKIENPKNDEISVEQILTSSNLTEKNIQPDLKTEKIIEASEGNKSLLNSEQPQLHGASNNPNTNLSNPETNKEMANKIDGNEPFKDSNESIPINTHSRTPFQILLIMLMIISFLFVILSKAY